MKEVQWTYYLLIYSFIYYIQIVFLSCTRLSVYFLSCDVLHLCLIILPLTVFSQHAPFNLSQTALTSVGHFQQFVGFFLANLLWITVPLFWAITSTSTAMTFKVSSSSPWLAQFVRVGVCSHIQYITPVSSASRLQPVWVCVCYSECCWPCACANWWATA